MAVGTDVKPDQRGLVVILPAELHRAFRYAALEDERPMAALVRELIVDYLEKREDALSVVK